MLYGKAMTSHPENSNEEKNFGEFRRKVKSAEVLSASMEHLLMSLHFTGRVSVVMQNGRVLKSGLRRTKLLCRWLLVHMSRPPRKSSARPNVRTLRFSRHPRDHVASTTVRGRTGSTSLSGFFFGAGNSATARWQLLQ